MTGFLYAFGAAVFAATSDALSKEALRDRPVLVVAWARLAYTAPFLLSLLLFIELPRLDWTFAGTILVLIPLEIAALILYMKALQISPLSLTVPFLSLTPAFSLVTSFLILGEIPDLSGTAGIFLIVFGAYFLNVHLSRKGILEPLRAILRERGSLLMVVVAFIYSVTSNLGKLAILHSSSLFMAMFYMPFVALAMLPLAVRAGMRPAHLRDGGKLFWLLGASQALMSICHFEAISLILVSYMISIKRLSLVFSVLLGRLIFREQHLEQRLLGSGMMVAGVILIVLR